MGGAESLHMGNQVDGYVTRIGLLTQEVEGSSRVYLHMGPSESIKDHGRADRAESGYDCR